MAARAFAALHSVPFYTAGQLFCRNSQDRCDIWNASNSVCSMRGIAKSEARRRKREGKKIGEQVQLEKLKERERSKKDMQERLKGLKRCASFSSFIIFYSLIFLVIVKRTGCST